MHPSLPPLLRLLQLCSPALPVGAYAYSQGLEWAVQAGWVRDEATAREWITGVMRDSLARLDVPILIRLYGAWERGDGQAAREWNHYLAVSRGCPEFRDEDFHLGRSLARLLPDLDVPDAAAWKGENPTFAVLFSLAARHWGIGVEDACAGYLWTWAENQVAAAIKLVPLGQTAGQRILSEVATIIPDLVEEGMVVEDDGIGAITPGLTLAGMMHETQHTRLFRS